MQGQTVKTLAFKLRQLRQPRTNLCVDLFAGASAVHGVGEGEAGRLMEQSDDLRSGSAAAAAAARSAKFGRARVEHAVCLSVRPTRKGEIGVPFAFKGWLTRLFCCAGLLAPRAS